VGSLTLNAKPDAIWSIVAYPMPKAALNMLTVQYARAFPRWRVNSVTPGLALTEFTGRPTDSVDLEALRRAGGTTVDEAVAILVTMATVSTDGPTGTFVGNDGPLPWWRRPARAHTPIPCGPTAILTLTRRSRAGFIDGR